MGFEVGDRVKFTNNSHRYSVCRENPLAGSEYECEGVVYKALALGSSVLVLWDNGEHNGYQHEDLSLSSNPYGNVESFWE